MHEPAIKDIISILRPYLFGNIHHIERIKHGFANINYRIDTDRGTFLMRFCRKQALQDIEKEMYLMKVLKKRNFPTAYPVPASDGQYIHQTDYYPVVIYEYLTGYIPRPVPYVIQQVATALAQLHRIPVEEIQSRSNAVNPEVCRKLIRIDDMPACIDDHTKRQLSDSFVKAERFLYEDLPEGLIHADPFPDNTLFRKKRLVALLDFEEFAIDHFLFDIGMAVNGFCISGNMPDRKKIRIFLSSYETVRPLEKKEKELLDIYTGWTALAMACWHLGDCLRMPKPGQKERIEELTRRASLWLT